MSKNYANPLPKDEGGTPIQGLPPQIRPNARYGTNNATASSVITLGDNSVEVEVSAVGASVAFRWVPATETAGVAPFASVITTGASANFDFIVPKDGVRRFVAPLETQGVNSVVGIGVQAGAFRRYAVMSATAVSSILTSEF